MLVGVQQPHKQKAQQQQQQQQRRLVCLLSWMVVFSSRCGC
jgi:hypothetical protein